jgi:hypothetical protein
MASNLIYLYMYLSNHDIKGVPKALYPLFKCTVLLPTCNTDLETKLQRENGKTGYSFDPGTSNLATCVASIIFIENP